MAASEGARLDSVAADDQIFLAARGSGGNSSAFVFAGANAARELSRCLNSQEVIMIHEKESTPMRVRHLGREVATAVELALVAMAPNEIVEPLALAAGLLLALRELPLDSEALRVRAQEAVVRADRSLDAWHHWEAQRRVTA